MKKIILFLIVLGLVGFVGWVGFGGEVKEKEPTLNLVSEVYYRCADRKEIKASYYGGPQKPVPPGEPPIPSGKVELVLSDGRELSLLQTISASGLRYASSDETIVFWSKGEGAFMTENDQETYTNCAERIWTLGNQKLDEAVTNFLLSREEVSWGTATGSQNVCLFQNLYPERDLFPFYLWVRCGEYRLDGGSLVELSGTSVPVKIDHPNELSYYDLNKFSLTIPRDGSLYDGDLKKIFPKEIWTRLNFESQPLNEKIRQEAEQRLGLSTRGSTAR